MRVALLHHSSLGGVRRGGRSSHTPPFLCESPSVFSAETFHCSFHHHSSLFSWGIVLHTTHSFHVRSPNFASRSWLWASSFFLSLLTVVAAALALSSFSSGNL